MKTFAIIVTVVLMVNTWSFAQDPWNDTIYCNTDPVEPSDETTLSCSLQSAFWDEQNRLHFAPDGPEIFNANINFIVLHRDNAEPKNWQDNELFQGIISRAVDTLNLHYNNLCEIPTSSYPNCFDPNTGEPVFIPSINLEFSYNTYFISDSINWGTPTPSTSFTNYINSNDPWKHGVNIYFTMDSTTYRLMVEENQLDTNAVTINWVNILPSEYNMNLKQYMVLPNKYAEYVYILNNSTLDTTEVIDYFVEKFANIWKHELGHVFGLRHNSISPHYNLNECLHSFMHQGSPDACWLPPSEIGEMHRLIHTSNVRRYISADTYFDSLNYIVSDTQVWDYNLRLYSDVIVESGGILEVTCKLYMPEEAKIIIKRGGKLIVNEGLITSYDTVLWVGIEVWGDPLQPHTNEALHGVVELKNGAIIENANCAISTTRKNGNGSLVQGYHGGIVRANQTTFKNNKRAIEIWPYDFTYKSSFERCSFSTTKALYGNNNFEYFMILSDVEGVTIEGCEFENSRPATDIHMDYRGYGIYSTESQYTITASDSDGSSILNFFRKLDYGIKALGLTASRAPSITACSLEYNRTGIYLGGITSASVLSNYFLVESFDTTYDQNIYCGLYLDNSTQYHVEDNFFEHDISTTQNEYHTIGITVNNSGDQDNWIYRNIFKTLDIGILAQNQNRDQTRSHGLFIKCNDFGDNNPNDPSLHDNTYDIAVTKSGDCDFPGIKEHQGSNISQSSPAGNRFSQASNGIVDSDYSNPPESPRIFYWQHDPTNEPRINLTYHIPLHVTKRPTNQPWDETYCCPPSFYPGGSGEIESNISSFQSDVDSVNMLLTALVDGGNTQELESDVILSTPDQSYDLYTDLTMKSPYLTDTVMIEAVRKENVLNEVMVRDILVANPQSAKSDEVMDELDSRMSPLPDYMISEIEQGNDSLGDKEIMEASKYHYLHKRNICINDLKRYYKTDTSGLTNRDTLINFLVNSNSIQSKYELAFEHFLNKNYSNTNTVLSNIPSQFVFSSVDNDLYQDYSDYFDFIIDLKQNNNHYYDIDSLQINILDSLSNDIYSYPGAYARNVLLYNDAISYNEPYILPDSTLKAEEFEESSSVFLQDYPVFKLYPNPAANHITIEYDLKSKSCNGYVEFINLQGKLIRLEELSPGKHSKIIPLNNDFSSGTYLCKLVCNGNIIGTQKVSIIK